MAGSMDEVDFKRRTKQYALRVMKVVEALPENNMGWNLGGQLLRSATSVGANYRAACRARSKKEFVHKLGISEEEADESCFWLELVVEGKLLPEKKLGPLLNEGNELVKLITASRKTALRNLAAEEAKAAAGNRKSKIENRK